MTKKSILKLLPVWAAVVAVFLIAGIVLMSILGFNEGAERPESTTVDVDYNIAVKNDENKVARVEEICEEVFDKAGLTVLDSIEGKGVNTSQDRTVRRYTFSSSVTSEKLAEVTAEIGAKFDAEFTDELIDIRVDYHRVSNLGYSDFIWRGSVGLAVGIVVALIYVGIRFGVGCAVTGLTVTACGGALPVCLVAITRIPVYASAPLFYAALGAVTALLLWLVFCMKLRDVSKNSARPAEAEEVVHVAWKGALLPVAVVTCVLAVIIAIPGAVATAGVRALLLPALLSVVSGAYPALLLGPSLHVYVRAHFDKLAAKRKPRYLGSKKQDKATKKEENA